MLSAITRSEIFKISDSSSCFVMVSEPIAVICVPGRISLSVSSGSDEAVVVIIRLHLLATSCGDELKSTLKPSLAISV